jgi:predicted RNA binding protein YcfA (HicA-like mRNA interferase family)
MSAVHMLTHIVSAQYHAFMPKKIRDLIHDLEKAGFEDRGGKGSHRNYSHPQGAKVTLSGNPSHDAKRYQEREVDKAIREVAG